MLSVAACQLRHPIALLVLTPADDGLSHRHPYRRSGSCKRSLRSRSGSACVIPDVKRSSFQKLNSATILTSNTVTRKRPQVLLDEF
jgi:hypothetical protein